VHGSSVRLVRGASVALSLLFIACGKTEKAPSADSAAISPPSQTARTLSGAPRSARVYPGALTKPIDAYTGDEFYVLTRNLRYAGSHERQRRCRNTAGCTNDATSRRTLVQVSAVATQDSLSAPDVPEFGVVQVRAINRGDTEEARYGLRPGRTLRYYLIVHRDSAGALRWRMEELDTATPRRHVQVGTGTINGCGHAWTPGARADFKTCEDAARSDSVTTLPLVLQAQLAAPMWMSCDQGCCEAR
jgi:hypothetical protein